MKEKRGRKKKTENMDNKKQNEAPQIIVPYF